MDWLIFHAKAVSCTRLITHHFHPGRAFVLSVCAMGSTARRTPESGAANLRCRPQTELPMSVSLEARFRQHRLPLNQARMDPFFGDFFRLMRKSLSAGSSEFGMGMSLFSLVVSIRAANVVEIGRFRGFSTLCLASGLRLVDLGWQEPAHNKQRPDVDYPYHEGPRKRTLISIDPHPTQEAIDLVEEANLSQYVEFLNLSSEECRLTGFADIILIDGDHSYEGCRRDCTQYVTKHLRPGGYFILHDYFGWYGDGLVNRSPIKDVADEIIAGGAFQNLLIDTGYMSLMVFRKPDPLIDC
jgi:predicted O-methyltransferase YrrM